MKRDLCLRYYLLNRYERSVLLSLVECYDAIYQRIQRVILADTHVCTRMMNRTSLTNDDVTSLSYLTTKKLNTSSFTL